MPYRTMALPAAARKILSGLIANLLTCFCGILSCSYVNGWGEANPLRLQSDLSIAYPTPSLPESYRVVICTAVSYNTPGVGRDQQPAVHSITLISAAWACACA